LTLLAPIPALIAACVGVPVLLVLYFLKLRRTSVRVGSTMLWSRAARDLEVNIPWRWPRASWMLILQLLGLLCLCVALGRPALNMPGAGAGRMVILIDRSASMSAVDIPGDGGELRSRLDAAKSRALELIDSAWASDMDEVAVGSFAGSAGILTSWTHDRATLREQVEGVTPTDQPGSLRSAMDVLALLAPDATGEGGEGARVATAYVLSDGGFIGGEAPGVPGGVDLRFLRVGPGAGDAGVSNQGIVSVSTRRDADDPLSVRATARVVSNAPGEVVRTLRATIDGRDVGSVVVRVPGASERRTAESASASDSPTPAPPLGGGVSERAIAALGGGVSEVVVNLTVRDRGGGVLVLELGGGDALASDDRVQLVLDGAALPRVVLVGPGEDGSSADAFVRSFLLVASAEPLEVIGPGEMERRLGVRDGFAGVDLVVLDRVEPSRWPAVATLSLGAGGPGVVLKRGVDDRRTRVVSWRRELPVLRDVDLSAIELVGAGRLEAGDGATVLAEGVDGALMVALTTGAVRRVVSAVDLSRTGWGSDVGFVVFMSNALDWLTLKGQGRAGRWTTTSQVVRVLADAGTAQVGLRGPVDVPGAGTRWFAVPAVEVGGEGQPVVVPMGVPERVGVYEVVGARVGESPVCVNLLDAGESGLETRQTLTVGARGVGSARGEGRTPREVWPWFVLAAAVLLSAEWLVFAVRGRG